MLYVVVGHVVIVGHDREEQLRVDVGIGVDEADGLLRAGEPGVQLTWMDAKVGDWVVTPRIGKPVEVNALWYHALECMTLFALECVPEDAGRFEAMAHRVRASFQKYVDPETGGLIDVLDEQDLTPENLAAGIEKAIANQAQRKAVTIKTDGAAETARLVTQWLQDR